MSKSQVAGSIPAATTVCPLLLMCILNRPIQYTLMTRTYKQTTRGMRSAPGLPGYL